MVVTIFSVITGFPLPTVLLIVCETKYEYISAIHRQLDTNLASI